MTQSDQYIMVCKDVNTVVVGHPAIKDHDFAYMKETCAGIGAVPTGFSKCGVSTAKQWKHMEKI